MSEINTTNLNDLPSMTGNIQMNIQNNDNTLKQESPNQVSLDQSTISQIVNGLQQASITGATRLPSRDIPMTQTHISHDDNARPNYVPTKEMNKYINDDEFINIENKSAFENKSVFEKIYDDFQYPLLLAIMYFIFQMPAFKNAIFNNFSFLFSIDGNYNINGLTIISIVFSLIYYFFTNILFASIK